MNDYKRSSLLQDKIDKFLEEKKYPKCNSGFLIVCQNFKTINYYCSNIHSYFSLEINDDDLKLTWQDLLIEFGNERILIFQNYKNNRTNTKIYRDRGGEILFSSDELILDFTNYNKTLNKLKTILTFQ